MSPKTQPFNWPDGQDSKYLDWAESAELNEIKTWIRQQYKSYQMRESYDRAITFLDRPLQNGFHVKTQELQWPSDYSRHLFYYIFLSIKGIDYINQLQDSRFKGDVAIDRLYFKPSLYRLLKTPTRNRLYGNITIELSRKNDRVETLSFQCDRYAQRGDEFDDYDELMDYLFAEN